MEWETKRISRQLLKTLSGEFDLESIQSINLSGLGIEDLGDISACVCLEHLDLSKNLISDLRPLSTLKQLVQLNLSNNSVSFIDDISELDSLEVLNLAGNSIKSIEALKCLSKLPVLEKLRLEDGSDRRNPVCDHTEYHATVKVILPQLRALDNDRLMGEGSDIFSTIREMQKELLDSNVDPTNIVIPSPTQWVPTGFWDRTDSVRRGPIEAEQKFKELLKECSSLSMTAEKSLNEV